MRSEFDYLIEKIRDTGFRQEPFEHLYIKDFLSAEHFAMVTQSEQVKFAPVADTRELIDQLHLMDYGAVVFPGCTTSITEYLGWLGGQDIPMPEHTDNLTSGFGMTFRIAYFADRKPAKLMAFLKSVGFCTALREKFGLPADVASETGLQKYLTGYEISPHPDIRKKLLTYMLNVNQTDGPDVHCRLMRFKAGRQHVPKFWDERPGVDRCWVPWPWCEEAFVHSANNSMLMFAPSNDSLHAIKLDYDHTKTQRTQIYGNTWQLGAPHLPRSTWRNLP